MKTVAFHSNQLGMRGTEVALYDYARYNEEILGNKSIIVSDSSKELSSLPKFESRFEVCLYDKFFDDCYPFMKQYGANYIYYIKSGENDGKLVPGIKNLVHAVFQTKDPHGDAYMYVSEWLADQMGAPSDFVPHIVDLPQPTRDYREKLKVSEDQIVIGRYGGRNDFDLPFVWKAVYDAVQSRSDLVFLFMDTRPFGPPHPNIIFVGGTHSVQNKSNFVATCDYMIHGRSHGESFGLAIGEFLFHDKPVIAWRGGLDKNHLKMLRSDGLFYDNNTDLQNILVRLQPNQNPPGTSKNLVKDFTPENVMKRFDEKFLSA